MIYPIIILLAGYGQAAGEYWLQNGKGRSTPVIYDANFVDNAAEAVFIQDSAPSEI